MNKQQREQAQIRATSAAMVNTMLRQALRDKTFCHVIHVWSEVNGEKEAVRLEQSKT